MILQNIWQRIVGSVLITISPSRFTNFAHAIVRMILTKLAGCFWLLYKHKWVNVAVQSKVCWRSLLPCNSISSLAVNNEHGNELKL